jgi:hypothetical protein
VTSTARAKTFTKFLLAQEAAVIKVTSEVHVGKYQTREEAGWAVAQAIRRVAEKMAKEDGVPRDRKPK